MELTAPADGYCFFVNLFVPHEATRYSDNFFDLAPGEQVTIEVTNDEIELEPTSVAIGWQ